ncbi:PREDICTED: uncharacterized protein LOC105147680 [Acromyrmex echinatior]|uniref:uncharacterized protein LOC105147680 n=1 Tax=Acromyrmex echinatior TaxID=103372 RepID=UPI000580FEA4|nr:PREDICTED: uncharacterized protein LOC105147680 [Acromyrmex echinatior]
MARGHRLPGLSDHRLIRMELVSIPAEVSRRRCREKEERQWALRKLDLGALEVNLIYSTWLERNPANTVEEGSVMSRTCDASMPRCRPMAGRATYWWSEKLVVLRRVAVAARKSYSRRRRGTDEEKEAAAGALRDARSP